MLVFEDELLHHEAAHKHTLRENFMIFIFVVLVHTVDFLIFKDLQYV